MKTKSEMLHGFRHFLGNAGVKTHKVLQFSSLVAAETFEEPLPLLSLLKSLKLVRHFLLPVETCSLITHNSSLPCRLLPCTEVLLGNRT